MKPIYKSSRGVLSETGTQRNFLSFLKKHSETLLISGKKKKKSFSVNALKESGTIQVISSEGMWKCLPIYSLQLEFSPGYSVLLFLQPVVTPSSYSCPLTHFV